MQKSQMTDQGLLLAMPVRDAASPLPGEKADTASPDGLATTTFRDAKGTGTETGTGTGTGTDGNAAAAGGASSESKTGSRGDMRGAGAKHGQPQGGAWAHHRLTTGVNSPKNSPKTTGRKTVSGQSSPITPNGRKSPAM